MLTSAKFLLNFHNSILTFSDVAWIVRCFVTYMPQSLIMYFTPYHQWHLSYYNNTYYNKYFVEQSAC